MKRKEKVRRYVLFLISLLFMALGVALTKRGALGVSPTSSVANVMSCWKTSVSIGNWLILWNCVLILGQILILRKKFQLIQLLQFPLSFPFGWFTDLWMWCVSRIPVEHYAVQLLLVLCGIGVLSFGVALSVIADVIMNSGEAFVKAIADSAGWSFGNVKVGFDIGCVLLSVLLSLILFHGKIVGTREGTIMTALLTGVIVKFLVARLKAPIEKILKA